MYSVIEIPHWQDSGAASIGDWWREMAERTGTVFHPDDAPAEIVDPDGDACFTVEACEKLETALNSMVQRYGDLAYAEAHKVFMARLGWTEAGTGDGWIKVL